MIRQIIHIITKYLALNVIIPVVDKSFQIVSICRSDRSWWCFRAGCHNSLSVRFYTFFKLVVKNYQFFNFVFEINLFLLDE